MTSIVPELEGPPIAAIALANAAWSGFV